MVTMKKIVTVVQPEPGSVKKPFRINTSYRLGVTQILLGVLCFVFHIVALAVDAAGDRAGHGLWAGAAFMITGTAAVIAAYRPTQNPITIMFFLSIVSTCLAVMMLVIAAVALSVDVDQQLCDSFGACREPVVTKESRWRTRLAMNSLLLILGIIETPLAIWSAYICGTVQIVLAATPPMPEPRVEPHPPNRPYAYNPEVIMPSRPDPYPPQRSEASREASRHLAMAHGYQGSQQQYRSQGYLNQQGHDTPDYNSNRRAPLPTTDPARDRYQSSTLPRPGAAAAQSSAAMTRAAVVSSSTLPRSYGYDNIAAEVPRHEYYGDYRYHSSSHLGQPDGTAM